MMFFIILIAFCYSFDIKHHVKQNRYKEVHPLFDLNEIDIPMTKNDKEKEYIMISLHDAKFYDNVTYIMTINTKNNQCTGENSIDIDNIEEELNNDNCTLYTSLILSKY